MDSAAAGRSRLARRHRSGGVGPYQVCPARRHIGAAGVSGPPGTKAGRSRGRHGPTGPPVRPGAKDSFPAAPAALPRKAIAPGGALRPAPAGLIFPPLFSTQVAAARPRCAGRRSSGPTAAKREKPPAPAPRRRPRAGRCCPVRAGTAAMTPWAESGHEVSGAPPLEATRPGYLPRPAGASPGFLPALTRFAMMRKEPGTPSGICRKKA